MDWKLIFKKSLKFMNDTRENPQSLNLIHIQNIFISKQKTLFNLNFK